MKQFYPHLSSFLAVTFLVACGGSQNTHEQTTINIMHVEDAVSRARSGDLASARTDLQQLINEPFVEAHALYGLGVIAFYEREEASALDFFDRAMTSDPMLTEALIATIQVYLRDDDVSGARRIFERQIEVGENAVQIRATELYILLHEGLYNQVISQGSQMLHEDPANLDIHFAMGMANFHLERYELARYIMQISIDQDSNRPDFYFLLSMIEQANGNSAEAESWLNQVIQINSNHPEAHNNLGIIQLESLSPEEALLSFQTAIEHATDFKEAWLNLGNAYKRFSETAEAQNAFEQAIAIDNTYPDPYFNLGILYLDAEFPELTRQESCQTSIDYFAQYRDLHPGIAPDNIVFSYNDQAVECVQTEIQMAEMEAEAEENESVSCEDDFGFPCNPGDPDCFAPDGSVCSNANKAVSFQEDAGFANSHGESGDFNEADNEEINSEIECFDDFGSECFLGDPDTFTPDRFVTLESWMEEFEHSPESDLVDEDLVQIALNSQKFFDFERAIATFMALHERGYSSEELEYPILNAAQLLQYEQQYEASADAYMIFLEEDPNTHIASTVLYLAAGLYGQAGNHERMFELYSDFRDEYGNDNSRIIDIDAAVIISLQTEAEYRTEHGETRSAERLNERILDEYNRRQSENPHAKAVVAAIIYQQAMDLFNEWNSITFGETLASQTDAIAERIAGIEEIINAFSMVIDYGVADWSVCAGYQVGYVYKAMAETVMSLPRPDFHGDVSSEDEYFIYIEDLTNQYEDTAITRWEGFAYPLILQFRVQNECTVDTMQALNRFLGAEYPSFSEEIRARSADLFSPQFMTFPEGEEEQK